MRNQELRQIANELQNLYAMQDEIKAQVVEREQQIKAELEAREISELNLGNCVIHFAKIVTDRLSTKAVKDYLKSLNLLTKFTVSSTSKRFSIAF